MTPYRIRSQSVSERRRRGTSAGGLDTEPHSRSQNKTPLSCGDNGVWGRPLAARRVKLPCRGSAKSTCILYGRDILSTKNAALKRFLRSFRENSRMRHWAFVTGAVDKRLQAALLIVCPADRKRIVSHVQLWSCFRSQGAGPISRTTSGTMSP